MMNKGYDPTNLVAKYRQYCQGGYMSPEEVKEVHMALSKVDSSKNIIEWLNDHENIVTKDS